MALTMPVLRPKQSAKLAATLNSPPLTWIWHSVALRNGTMPGSRRWISAPSDTKSSAPSRGIFITCPQVGDYNAWYLDSGTTALRLLNHHRVRIANRVGSLFVSIDDL